MGNDDIPQPRPRLTDEAATQMLDFLYDLVADFESAYAGQILRYRQAEAEHQHDLRQLPPCGDPDGDPF
ncbi:MAG TPA: hypothetical protein PK435_14150 [Thermoanaerobaculaceae bacterium]|nr:hypothetical protein [Thermoanaerobaculaceae bacterium]